VGFIWSTNKKYTGTNKYNCKNYIVNQRCDNLTDIDLTNSISMGHLLHVHQKQHLLSIAIVIDISVFLDYAGVSIFKY
jgi:hypothetical protein